MFIQTLSPYFVATKMVPLEPNLFVPRAADYVREAIKTVGYARNTTGYAPHEFLVRYVDQLAKSIQNSIF